MVKERARGFAVIPPARLREISAAGGRAAHAQGTAHEWSSAEAREAGRRGGLALHHHDEAAFHHETAAHHHREAARHAASGGSPAAARHARMAHEHAARAALHARRALHEPDVLAANDADRFEPDDPTGRAAARIWSTEPRTNDRESSADFRGGPDFEQGGGDGAPDSRSSSDGSGDGYDERSRDPAQ